MSVDGTLRPFGRIPRKVAIGLTTDKGPRSASTARLRLTPTRRGKIAAKDSQSTALAVMAPARVSGAFAEPSGVLDCEASEVIEAPGHRDVGDARVVAGALQRLAHARKTAVAPVVHR